MTPKVSLDQWRTLQAVIDQGGYAQAANQLHRSQSSVSYAVHRMQELLGIQLLQIEGRKAVLTDAGKVLLQRSRQLVTEASSLEQQARQLQQGWEAEIRLAVEAAYPTDRLLEALKRFGPQSRCTQIRLQEVVLSGAEEILLNGKADLVITPYIPQGFLGEELMQVEFVAVALASHPLHQLGRELYSDDLSRETQIIVSDSGSKGINAGWLSDTFRWAVTSLESACKLISNGLGYGWLPKQLIEPQLKSQQLKMLPLKQGQINSSTLYLVFADLNQSGPATQLLANILKQVSSET